MVIDKQPTQRVSIVNSLWTISLIFLWSWAEYDSYILEQALRLVSHHSFWLVAELCIVCVCVCVRVLLQFPLTVSYGCVLGCSCLPGFWEYVLVLLKLNSVCLLVLHLAK